MLEPSAALPYDAATLFNGYVGAHVVFALQDLGVWDRLANGPVSAAGLAAQAGADPVRLRTLLDSASRFGYVEVREGIVQLTKPGCELVNSTGFFTWGVGGYGEMLRGLAALTKGWIRWGRDVSRDEEHIASGSAQVGRALITPVETDLLAELDFSSVADLGCGDGSRLLRLCGGRPPRRGLGLDISKAACALAAQRITAAGLTDHVEIRCQNIFAPGNQSVFRGFDLVSSFLMLHDLFAIYDDGAHMIRALRAAFPDAHYFLLADTNAQPWQQHKGPLPIFSVQFELVHAFMGVPILPKEAYEEAFRNGGLEIERCEPLGVPSTWLYLLRVAENAS